MFKSIVVFAAFFVAVYAIPGYIEVTPASTSHVSRIDIVHPQPVTKTYYGDYDYGHGYGSYGQGYGYGGFGHGSGYGYSGARSYSNRVDYPSVPVAVSYGHSGYGYGHGGWDY